MSILNINELNNAYANKQPEEVIKFIIERIGEDHLALASSLSIEDQVLTDMIQKINPQVKIFFIDTGRHFQKTYELMAETMRRYRLHYEVYAPNHSELETFVSAYGPNGFYDRVELRKKCCKIRKVNPLQRALGHLEGWICGLRRGQGVTRQEAEIFEWDESHSLYKINPLVSWSEENVWEYIKEHHVPYNGLYEQGFRSIGCEPCTRAVVSGEDIRSGRWWWEEPEKKECGLHNRVVGKI